MYLLSDL